MALTFDLQAANDDDVVAVFPSMADARRYLERTAAWALDLLDQVTGDPDLEDGSDDEPGGDDEPALGWSGVAQLRLTAQEDGETSLGWANEGSQARLHAEGRGDECEPDLGWTTMGVLGSTDDREEENEHGADDDEGEPDEQDCEYGALDGGSGL